MAMKFIPSFEEVILKVASAADLPTGITDGRVAITLDTGDLYRYVSGTASWSHCVVFTPVPAIGLDAETDANKITAIITALRTHGLLGPNA